MSSQAITLNDLGKGLRGVHERLDRIDPRRASSQPSPRAMIARAVASIVIGHIENRPAEDIAAERFHKHADALQLGLRNPASLITRAATSPASTSGIAWAAELVAPPTAFFDEVAPASVYSQLSRRGVRVTFGKASTARILARAETPVAGAIFVAEGQPIRVARIGLSGATLASRKAGVISFFTTETFERSAPNIVNVVERAISNDTGVSIDAILLDTNAATAIRPAGLLNGITPIAASTDTGVDGLVADIRALADAIAPVVSPTLIVSATTAMVLGLLAPMQTAAMQIIASPNVPDKQLILVDAAYFASAEGDEPTFDYSEQAVVHGEDTAPLPIGTAGSPPTVAAPSQSLWQSDLRGVRLINRLSWTMVEAGHVSTVTAVAW